MIVLVTGSRSWKFYPLIDHVLHLYAAEARTRREILVIRYGDCDQGADRLAAQWVRRAQLRGWPVHHDAYPADWGGPCHPELRCRPGHRKFNKAGHEYCPFAGHYRNEHMLRLIPAPDYVEAFHQANSSGTRHCADLADKLGLPLYRNLWERRHEDLHRTELATVSSPLKERTRA